MTPLSRNPVILYCNINNHSIPFEVDSGSQVSTINKSYLKKLNTQVNPTTTRLRGYSGSEVNILGAAHVSVKLNNLKHCHDLIVVDSCNIPNLLGRDLCSKFGINLLLPGNAATVHHVDDNVLSEFTEYLSPKFESCVKEEIQLHLQPNAKPKFCKARSVPVKMKESVKLEINRLVDAGIITRVFFSDWASPAVYIRKPDGKIRLCVDYSTTVNQHLEVINTPLPTIDEVIVTVGDAKVFSKLDLENAFLQLPLSDSSKNITTVSTSEGLFQYNFLPFGLKSSPGLFQSFMSKLLHNVSNVIIYQDDVLIMTPDVASHQLILREVLSILKNAGIKLNTKKCKFYTDEVTYLGHIFNNTGVHTDPEKIKAIVAAPPPENLKQLQSFLGLSNFYSRFVPGFASTVQPLYQLLKKGVPFSWGNEQQMSFLKIKDLLAKNRALTLFNPNHQTMLETDASNYGIGGVLFQRKDCASAWHMVHCISRTLNNAEKNYSNIEREALSVVYAVDKFKKFLLGTHFVIHNDHAPLRKLLACDAPVPSTCSARIQRWALKLSQFNYEFKYSKGSINIHADCLSRLPLADTVEECEPYEIVFMLDSLEKLPVTCEQIRVQTQADPNLSELIQYIKYGAPPKITNPALSKYKSVLPQLTLVKGCILYNNRVLIPPSLQSTVLEMFHSEHPGISAMKSLARSIIWYPGLDIDIENMVKNCITCQTHREKPPQTNNVEWPTPERPWSRIHIDHFFLEDKICLIAIDALTKYIECEVVRNTSVQETIDTLRLLFSRNGLCDILVSDNATCFTADNFQQFLKQNGIQHVTSPPYCPSSNGQGERAVRTIKDMMKKNECNASFKTRLSRVLLQYRCTPHSVTKIAPSVALNNRKYVTVKDRVHPNYDVSKSTQNPNRKIVQFEVGQDVLALNLRDGPKWRTAVVVEKIAINVYNVQVKELGVIWKRHSNQLLPATATLQQDTSEAVRSQNENDANTQRKSGRNKNPVSRFGFE